MKPNKKLHLLQNLIQSFCRLSQEIMEFEDFEDEENYFSVIHQRRIDKAYEQTMDSLKELRLLRREIQQKLINEEKKEKIVVKSPFLPKDEPFQTLSFIENLNEG